MRRVCIVVAAAMAGSGAFVFVNTAAADSSPPGNLGNGLSRLVDPPPKKAGIRMTQAPLTILDRRGRVLVDVYATDSASLSAVRTRTKDAGFKPVTTSRKHKAIEGFVAIGDIKGLAKLRGVASVAQALRPYTKVGAATSQGVHAQRVDRVRHGINGRGITVGALSDSFDTATETVDGKPLAIHAKQDIASGDLPKDGVTVIEDDDSGVGADEGRAMLQIVHDIAPRAKECFATADTGDFGFGDNIRALADPKGKCGADVIVDDVGYFDEPFYGRGPI